MAKHKYGIQKLVQNDLQICINSFERMKRGGIGIADECVEDTCKRALKYIDELEAKLAESEPVRHGQWVKEKKDVLIHWHCSACRECYFLEEPNAKYCPNCGAKMGEQ